MTTLGVGGVLDRTLPYHPIIDVFRVVGIVMAVGVAIFLVYLTWGTGKRSSVPPRPGAPNRLDPIMVCSLLIFELCAITQELEQLGRPFVWWRLPLLVLGSSFAVRGIARRL